MENSLNKDTQKKQHRFKNRRLKIKDSALILRFNLQKGLKNQFNFCNLISENLQ